MQIDAKTAKFLAFIVVSVVALALWSTWPSGGSIDIRTCQPSGVFPRLSLALYQDKFWQNQLEKVRRDISSADKWRESLLRRHAEVDSLREKTREFMEKTYREVPELKPTPNGRQVQELRDAADDLEEHGAIDRLLRNNDTQLASFRLCETQIKKQLDLK